MRSWVNILELCAYNTVKKIPINVLLTTKLLQSNAADDNDVHERGNGEWQVIFQVLWCDQIATADIIACIWGQALALSFVILLFFTDCIHKQNQPHQSAVARKDNLCKS